MNKKKLGGFLAGLAGLAAAIVAAKQPHHAPPSAPPPAPGIPTYTLTAHVCKGDCAQDHKIPGASVTIEGQPTVIMDGAGNGAFTLQAGQYHVCAAADGYVPACADHRVPADGDVSFALERDVPAIQPLHADGRIFRTADGQPFRWKGVSSFALLDRFARGEDISDVFTAYQGYNVLRVWPYVPRADWGAKAWDQPNADVVVAFLARCEQAGFYVELTLLTDDDASRIDRAKALLAGLVAGQPRNLILEIANEPTTHKNINTAALKSAAMASGFLVSSGNYEDTRLFYGSWIGFHSGRDAEWPRRAHDAIDYWQGGGPDFPEEPAVKVPSVCDEPIRPDQANYNPQDFRAYFGSCALMSAGGTLHTETGKFGLPPTPEEARIAAVVLDALNAFPADAPNGSYRRIDEQGRSLRTYVIGERFMVRVRPTTKDAPEPGWTALDGDGILWRKQ
jgi:hypothetical protein